MVQTSIDLNDCKIGDPQKHPVSYDEALLSLIDRLKISCSAPLVRNPTRHSKKTVRTRPHATKRMWLVRVASVTRKSALVEREYSVAEASVPLCPTGYAAEVLFTFLTIVRQFFPTLHERILTSKTISGDAFTQLTWPLCQPDL
jgi:hypothetical protein